MPKDDEAPQGQGRPDMERVALDGVETMTADGLVAGHAAAVWNELRTVTMVGEALPTPVALREPVGQDTDTVDSHDATDPEGEDDGERPRLPPRYEDLGLIGRGGMGEVRRVRDRTLNRLLAMKVMRSWGPDKALPRARFIEEAQATSQLQHPGIVPVHDMGVLDDGRLYFTMREIRGRTLLSVIDEVHAAAAGGPFVPTERGWTFHRLIEGFRQVCAAVGYAHSRGVIHRDLKPSNVMVGDYGEVLVVDWGLAKVLDRPELSAPVETNRSKYGNLETRVGQVAGTPVYMPPEQAQGLIPQLSPASDVYSLGAVLYHILAGRQPYRGRTSSEVLDKVLAGPPTRPERSADVNTVPDTVADETLLGDDGEIDEGSVEDPFAELVPLPTDLPEALVEICGRAMARQPHERFADANALGQAVEAWLDGTRQRDRAKQLVREAEGMRIRAKALRERAAHIQAQAKAALADVKGWEPEERKRAGWALQDEADRLARAVQMLELKLEHTLGSALSSVPDLEEAHALLAEHYLERHREAEAHRDAREAARLEALLRYHDRGRASAYLRGDGKITLLTEPMSAEVTLYRYVERHRRLATQVIGTVDRTPIIDAPLSMGTYLFELRHPGHRTVRYPVHISRQGVWDGIPPGGREPLPIELPPESALGEGDRFVPPGWFWSGGDDEAIGGLPRRMLWLDGFIAKATPVTNAEYIAFLDELVARGREEEALRHAPRERLARNDQLGPLLLGRTPDGRFQLQADAEGDQWFPDWPVTMITWASARAYCAWLAERDGVPWRLPSELEWEKMARGVDGRLYPWGDGFDPSWCLMRESHEGRPLPGPVGAREVDVSVYGVADLAGGVQEWCEDVYRPEGPPVPADGRVVLPHGDARARADDLDTDTRVFRGGAWNGSERLARTGSRYWNRATFRGPSVSFRPVRSWP